MRTSYIVISVVTIALLDFLGYSLYDYNTAKDNLKNIDISISTAMPQETVFEFHKSL
jgi:hypothetical protein